MGEGAEKSLDSSQRGANFATTAAVGHGRDSCRLWQEEQELQYMQAPYERGGSLRGEVRAAQNHLSFPCPTRALCSSHWTLSGDF